MILLEAINKNKIGFFVSIVLILLGIVILLFSINYRLNQEYLGFSLIISCLIYFMYKSKFISNSFQISQPEISTRFSLVLYQVFFILFLYSIMSILYYSNTYQRPFSYFLTVSFACSIIAVQILLSHKKRDHILIVLEIFLISINVHWSLFYLFPGFQGVDPWYHAGFIKEIVELGYISDITYNTYFYMPVMHSEVAVINLITAMNLKESYFLISFIKIVGTLYFFLIAKYIFNEKVGLLSILILNLSDQFIRWGVQSTPMTLGLFFVSIIFFVILVPRKGSQNHFIFSGLTLLILFVLIFTHSVSSFISFIIMFSFLIAIKLVSVLQSRTIGIEVPNMYINSNLVLVFGVVMLFYWMNIYHSGSANSFFDNAIFSMKSIFRHAEVGNVEVVTLSTQFDSFTIAINKFGYSILLIFSFVGFLVSFLVKKYVNISLILLFVTGVLFCWIYIPSLLGSNATLPDRWFLFTYPILSVFGAFGVLSLINSLGSTNLKSKSIYIFLFMVIYVFFMTTNSLVNPESSIYPKDTLYDFSYSRNSFYESEIVVGDFICNKYDQSVVVDLRYVNVFKYLFGLNNVSVITLSDPKSYEDGLILLRSSVLNGYISDSTTRYMFILRETPVSFIHTFESNKYMSVYNNGEVTGFCRSK